MMLTGHAVVRDASTETRAAKINFQQATGDISAEGGVRPRRLRERRRRRNFPGTPATISAEKMQGNSKTGRALYTGHARLWQGESVLEADSIELLRKQKQLNAIGNVRAVFPQAAARSGKLRPAGQHQSATKSSLWHLAAKSLTYQDLEDRAHLEGNVVVQSEAQRMRSSFWICISPAQSPRRATEKGSNATGAPNKSAARSARGASPWRSEPQSTAERAEYTAADGKFVMSGGNPTLFDGSQGTTTGPSIDLLFSG